MSATAETRLPRTMLDASPARVRRRWRPPLALFVAGAVFLLIALPTLGMAVVVIVSRSPDTLIQSLQEHFWRIVVVEALVLAGAGMVGYVFWRGLTEPLGRLVERADRVAQGGREFDATGPFGTREVARLAESFALTVSELQRRSRYMETFATHLAHELKSPLTAMRGAAELMREEGDAMSAEQRARFLGNIVEDAERMTSLVTRLRDLARADGEDARGRTTIATVATALRTEHPTLHVDVAVSSDATVPLSAQSLEIVLHHLLDNAARMGARHVRVGMDEIRTEENAVAVLWVENDGAPIPSGDRARVLEPFFTTRREEGGTGLGLAIVATVLGVAGGRIELDSADPVRFRISFDEDRGFDEDRTAFVA